MRKIVFIIFTFILVSCSGYKYLDYSNSGNNLNYNEFGFILFDNYNTFYSRKTIGMNADEQISYYQHFEIDIPKKIKNWKYSGTCFYIEYDFGQIVSIDPGTEIKNEKIENWLELEENDDLLNGISEYWIETHDKSSNNNTNVNKGRLTKIFSDGHSKIILFNIKKENIEKFSNIKNSLKYQQK